MDQAVRSHRANLGFCRLNVETAVFQCTMICVIEIFWACFGLFDIGWIGSLGNYVLDRFRN